MKYQRLGILPGVGGEQNLNSVQAIVIGDEGLAHRARAVNLADRLAGFALLVLHQLNTACS